MAEVVVLELVLDPSKLQAGAKAAADALGGLGDKAAETEKKLKTGGNALNSAFAASGGGIQIAQGITSTANAFGQLNVQAGLFGASRTILELGKTAQDFRKLGEATGAAGGAFSLLSAAIKASPMGAIATAIGLAAGAMALFGTNTNQATKEWEALGAQMDKSIAVDKVARMLGEPGFASRMGTLRIMAEKAAENVGKGGPTDVGSGYLSLDAFAKQLKAKNMDVVRSLAQLGYAEQQSYMQQGYYTPEGSPAAFKYKNPAGMDISPEMQLAVVMKARERLTAGLAQDTAERATGGMQGPGAELTSYGPTDYKGGTSPEELFPTLSAAQEQADKAMEELIAKGERFGATIGDAFFNVASGAQNARQAIAGLISDMARAASREAFAGLFGQVAKGFGKTFAQTTADVTP